MPTVVEGCVRQALAPDVSGASGSAFVTTTLYDVIAALHAIVGPDEDAVVVATVDHLLRAGRVIWLRNITAFRPRLRKEPAFNPFT